MTETSAVIAILDDEPDRLDAMVALLADAYPEVQVTTFDNAPEMIAWVGTNLRACVLICLDHDLGPNRDVGATSFDPGTGRDVADLLAGHSPTCPVLIHTTNVLARPGMILSMEDAGWQVDFVTPYDDLLWIREVWIESVRRLLA